MIVMSHGLCLGMLLLCSVWALSVNFADASAAHSLGSTQSGSDPSSNGPRKCQHRLSYIPHANGLPTIHFGSDGSVHSPRVNNPGKRGTSYNVFDFGQRRLITTVYKRVCLPHTFHRGCISSRDDHFQGGSTTNGYAPRNIKHQRHYSPSVVNSGHTGNAFVRFWSGRSRNDPSGYNRKYVPCIVSPSAIQMRSLHNGNPPSVDYSGLSATDVANHGQSGHSYRHFGSEASGSIPRSMPRSVVPSTIHFGSAHSGNGHGADSQGHSGNANSQSGSGQSTNDGNHYDHSNLAPSEINPPTIHFGSTHSGIAPSVDNAEHRGNAHSQSGTNSYDHSSFSASEIYPSTIHFGSAHSGTGHDADSQGHGGNAYSQTGSGQSTGEGNHYDHSNLSPIEINPPTIHFGSAHSGIGHDADNQGHGGNGYSQTGSGQSTNYGNHYDHSNLAPSEINPPTIHFGSAHSGTGHDADSQGHGGNAYSQSEYGQSTSEGNHYDHSNLSPIEINPPTMHFGSTHSGIAPSVDNAEHRGNAHSQSGTNGYDHSSFSTSEIYPSTIHFGSAHSGTGHDAGRQGYGGNGYSQSGSGQSTNYGNHYDHSNLAPSEISPPTIHFGSAHSGTGHGADNQGHGGNAYSQTGSGQSTSEGNHYDHSNLSPIEINPPTMHFGSAHSVIAPSVDNTEHRGNAHSNSAGNGYDHNSFSSTEIYPSTNHFGSLHIVNNPSSGSLGHRDSAPASNIPSVVNPVQPESSSIHYKPSKISPVNIYFGIAESLNDQNAAGLSQSANNLWNFGSGQSKNDANNYDQGTFVPSAVSHQQSESLYSPLEFEQGTHSPRNIVPNVVNPSTIHFGSAHHGTAGSAHNQGHGENAYSQYGSGQNTYDGNGYDHSSFAPSAVKPSTIQFGSLYIGNNPSSIGLSDSASHIPYAVNPTNLESPSHHYKPSVDPVNMHFEASENLDRLSHSRNSLGHFGFVQLRNNPASYSHSSSVPNADNPSYIYFGSDHSGTTFDEGNYVQSTRAPRIYEVISPAPTFAKEFAPNALNTDTRRIYPIGAYESIHLPRTDKPLSRLFKSALQERVVSYNSPHPQNPSTGHFFRDKFVHHIHALNSNNFKQSTVLPVQGTISTSASKSAPYWLGYGQGRSASHRKKRG